VQYTVQHPKACHHSHKIPNNIMYCFLNCLSLIAFQTPHIPQTTRKLSHFECIVFSITICITLRLVSQLIFMHNRTCLTHLQHCDISLHIHISVEMKSFISDLLLRLMSLTAFLFYSFKSRSIVKKCFYLTGCRQSSPPRISLLLLSSLTIL